MGRIIAINHLSLDGVMQAPGRADEDTSGGFEHGGWAQPGNDEVMGRFMGERMACGGPLLLGRRTYEQFYEFWPSQTDNPFTDVLNNVRKYVVSNTLADPLPWNNSTLVSGDAAESVAALKRSESDMAVMGSGELLETLMAHGLVDEYVLLIHPLVLGEGRRMFRDPGDFAALELVDSVSTTTGVIIATYRPREETR